MRRFYEDENYHDYIFDIENDFQHDVYRALAPVIRSYSRKRGVDPIELLDRYMDTIVLRLEEEFSE